MGRLSDGEELLRHLRPPSDVLNGEALWWWKETSVELTSIEPSEIVGCSCDGYSQLDAYLEARLREVELVAVCAGARPVAGRTDGRLALNQSAMASARSRPVACLAANHPAADSTVNQPAMDSAGSCPTGRAVPVAYGVATWRDVELGCERAHASTSRVLAIGASSADAALLERAWVGVAFADGSPAAISAADAVTRLTAGHGGLESLLAELEDLRANAS